MSSALIRKCGLTNSDRSLARSFALLSIKLVKLIQKPNCIAVQSGNRDVITLRGTSCTSYHFRRSTVHCAQSCGFSLARLWVARPRNNQIYPTGDTASILLHDLLHADFLIWIAEIFRTRHPLILPPNRQYMRAEVMSSTSCSISASLLGVTWVCVLSPSDGLILCQQSSQVRCRLTLARRQQPLQSFGVACSPALDSAS